MTNNMIIYISVVFLAFTSLLKIKAPQESSIYLLFNKAEHSVLEKSAYFRSTLVSKTPRKYKRSIEDEYRYFIDPTHETPLKFITKNKCNYYLTDSTILKKQNVKALKWIKESKIIKDGYNNSLPFKHIYICEKFGPNTYLITEVDMWIGSD